MTATDRPAHPGAYVRKSVLPAGMSVKEAARILGVGRPALSNFLNGRAALSPQMAQRLARSFGADREKLIELQQAFDAHGRGSAERDVPVHLYVPSFLEIRAYQIHEWATNRLDARHQLPAFLRKLVFSTARDLRRLEFPAYDSAERRGPDGVVEAAEATPWIPEGTSFWESGCDADPRSKADKDYAARMRSVPSAERATASFVFVTPHNWPGKSRWANEKATAGEWRSVRALDASDLEHWVEQSIPAQTWFGEVLGLSDHGCDTIDRCWERWAEASDPPMNREAFQASVKAHGGALARWLGNKPDRPFVVSADSKEEALAFIACLFECEGAEQFRDLVAVFRSAETLRRLAVSTCRFVPVASTDEVEVELASIYRRLHCVVVRPRNAVDSGVDVALEPLGHEAFEKALLAMRVERREFERLSRESGRSLTVLRRRLSRIEAIRTPTWARDEAVASSLAPMMLAGAWNSQSKADTEVLCVLARREYTEIEVALASMLRSDDSPVWSAGSCRGVVSRIDALYAVGGILTKKQLEDFFVVAEIVLSESDPAVELPEDARWAAGLYGKVRDHSAALRSGISEMVVALSVHGRALYSRRLGIDLEAYACGLVRRLLTPLSLEKLLSQDRDLPWYAEAAPDEFLRILEADLAQTHPIVLGLLTPSRNPVFGGCPRTGLLWALECLAWNPRYLRRVTTVLARLSETTIADNWLNKPSHSLEAIYRSWMPQTSSSLQDRIDALETLTKRFPSVGWRLCIRQFDPGQQTGDYSYRPRWRNDAAGYDRDVTVAEHVAFVGKAVELAIAWSRHDQGTLGDLVERLQVLDEKHQQAVWDRVDSWAASEGDDTAKAQLRERIRRSAFARPRRSQELSGGARERARSAMDKLTPDDPVARHSWLFAAHWVPESAEEIENEQIDPSARGKWVDQERQTAIREIWAGRGFEGVKALLATSEAQDVIGHYLAGPLKAGSALSRFLRRALDEADAKAGVGLDRCVRGLLGNVVSEDRRKAIESVASSVEAGSRLRLLKCAPFAHETWRLVEQESADLRRRYWSEVVPSWGRRTATEAAELIDRLLEVDRPRAAFAAVRLDLQQVETSRLKRLLNAIGTTGSGPGTSDHVSDHDLAEALDVLEGRTGVTSEEMAVLEFLFLRALDHTEHGIQNLERQIAASPALFDQAVGLAYKRSDDGQDPPEWHNDDPGRSAAAATAAHELLSRIRPILPLDAEGRVDAVALLAWIGEVRHLLALHGRAEVGDHVLGAFLAKAPPGDDGITPSIPVSEAVERIASPGLAVGLHIGIMNARGGVWRGEGGGQERELAARFREWARRRGAQYPYVGAILDGLAASYEAEGMREDSRADARRRLLQ